MTLRLSPPDLFFLLLFAALISAALVSRGRSRLLCSVAASFGCAAWALFVDAHTSEVTATLLVVVGGAFLLGLAAPAQPWRWAAIIGLAIPLKMLVAALAQGPAFDPRILVTLVFALAAAYAGALLRGSFSLAPVEPPGQK